ncbi:hypothetical protein HYDPIDRAFT_30625 [Hydnomerulius pinastri MD-312]|uniref:Unplaced genomic scaffold scaffold_23, whole genome shotgun sequence n=1 Tax=Hydnomerulius pinastri MD-312 TaxID=994086 RepID=A0A0C9V8P9_9AGAM|nr:hypothetical protein HYDPIDRAFT_30625 [Hydnomerulius pinastri MD-312]
MLLGDWYWNQSSHSKSSFKKLLSIIGDADFHPEDIQNTNWLVVDRELGDLGTMDVEEWLNEDAGWEHTTISISVPFRRCSPHPGLIHYSTSHFYHRSLVSIIREKVLDPAHHQLFHYKPYKLQWHPPHKPRNVRVYGELFTSSAFLKAHCKLQESPAEPECDLPWWIIALMFWLDMTQLTSFGDAKLWPMYMYFSNVSKYERCQPSSHLCTHAVYLQTLPNNFKDFALEHSGSKLPGNTFFTHCHCELFHAQWQEVLDDDFVQAYEHGMALTCCDGIQWRLFSRIFIYSADYPENKHLQPWLLSMPPMPHPKGRLHNLASERDILQHHVLARQDTEERCKKVADARRLIYDQQYVVDTSQVEALLKEESLVPTKNTFSEQLSHAGFDFFLMLVMDLLHEFELGVWKAVFIHLLRMLDSLKGHGLPELDRW